MMNLDDIETKANAVYDAVSKPAANWKLGLAALQVLATVHLARATYRVAETQEEAHK